MKLSIALTALLSSASVNAFAPSVLRVPSSTSLSAERLDTSEYVSAAIAASQTFGPTSKEARVAWDIVEEMDAADNSAAFSGGVNEDECLVAEKDESDACKEYYEKMEKLNELVSEQGPAIEKMKTLAQEIQAIKIPAPKPSAGKDSPELRAAMAKAKEASTKFGAKSAEARLAWADVEDIASGLDAGNALGGSLGDECLVETIEACEALDEINRVVQLDKETVRQS